MENIIKRVTYVHKTRYPNFGILYSLGIQRNRVLNSESNNLGKRYRKERLMKPSRIEINKSFRNRKRKSLHISIIKAQLLEMEATLAGINSTVIK